MLVFDSLMIEMAFLGFALACAVFAVSIAIERSKMKRADKKIRKDGGRGYWE